MAVSIGKRKRQTDDEESKSSDEDEGAMRTLFQRAFEGKFKPLENATNATKVQQPKDSLEVVEDEELSDWSGLSEDEDVIETVHQNTIRRADKDTQRQQRKVFMSSKPPTKTKRTVAAPKDTRVTEDIDPADEQNKKHDLALQRLLKESHLLDPTSFKDRSSAQDGQDRLKALDLRLKDLGATESSSQQQKMPLSHRKGIIAKAANREERRRKEAVENGVILEKSKHVSKGTKYRDKSVGGPAVGKFKGATLKLSSRDLRSIEGPKQKKRR